MLKVSNKARLITSIFGKITIAMLLGVSLFGTIVMLQYKPVYSVFYANEDLGYASSMMSLQKSIENYLQYGDSENVGYVILKEKPVYKFQLAKKNIETDDERIFAYIKDKCDVYYKMYAVESNDTEVCRVETLALAQEIVDKANEQQKKYTKKATLTISEKYEKEVDLPDVDIELAVADIIAPVKKINTEITKMYSKPASATVVSAEVLNALRQENRELNFTRPLENYVVTSRYGWRRNGTEFHTGIDYAAVIGTPIHAAEDGIVTCAKWSGNYGYLVKVQHSGGFETYYAHCSRFNVSVGDVVKQGDVVSFVGSTGRSTGPHVHFEIRYNGKHMNPEDLL